VWLLLGTLAERRWSAGSGSGDDGGRSRLGAPLLAAVATVSVLWAAPVVEQLTNEPGNMRMAFRWFRAGGTTDEPARGVLAGWRLVSAQFALLPEWLVGSRGITSTAEPPYLYEPVLPALLLVFGRCC
jgi:hypothetical protein